MKFLWTSLLVTCAVPALATENISENVIKAPTVSVSNIEKLGVTKNADIGLQLFATNLGIKFSDSTHVFNQLYATKKLKSWVYIQSNMTIGDKKAGEITTMPDGKSYFFVEGRTSFFVLAYGLRSDEVLSLRKEMLGPTHKNTKTALWERTSKILSFADLALSAQAAFAAENCLSSKEIQERLNVNSDSEFKVIKAAASCVNGAGVGVWNATGGAVKFMYDVAVKGTEQITCGAASLVNATWKRCDDYADAMKTTVDSTMTAVGNIKEVAAASIDGFSQLPGDVQAEVLCEMGSTVASGAAVTFATSGAGAPIALTRMSEVLNRVAKMPGMGKSSETLKGMATKVQQKAEQKSITHAAAKNVPVELKASLERVKKIQAKIAENAAKQDAAVERAVKAREKMMANPSLQQASIITSNYAHDLTNAVNGVGKYTHEETREILKNLMKYQKLDHNRVELAQKVLNSKKTGRFDGFDDDASDLSAFVSAFKAQEFKVNPELKLSTNEVSNKYRRDIGAAHQDKLELEAQVPGLERELNTELVRYRDLVEKNVDIDPADKEVYRAQVESYKLAVACNAADITRKASSGSQPSSTNSTGGAQ